MQRESSALSAILHSVELTGGSASNAQDWVMSATTAIRSLSKTRLLKSLTSTWEAIVRESRPGTVRACVP